VPALESKIDDLYRGPLDAFTASRNALAKTLSGAEAARVRKLPKPSVVPWAVNQLYWSARAAYDRLLKSGERLRKTQIALLEGRQADLRAAAEAHRAAIGDAVKEAMRVAAAAGSHPAADAVARTIEALSLMPLPPDPPGRLAEPLQPAGFEALSGVPVHSVAPSVRSVRLQPDQVRVRLQPERTRISVEPEGETKHEAREREKAVRAQALAAKAHAARVQKAEAALARAKSAAALAQQAAERAQRAVDDAEADLKRARAEGR
jgi:hypothetical protein